MDLPQHWPAVKDQQHDEVRTVSGSDRVIWRNSKDILAMQDAYVECKNSLGRYRSSDFSGDGSTIAS